MLRFCSTNIYYTAELSNDIADEIWTSEYPACVNDEDAAGIYEGTKLHKFDFNKDVVNNPDFFKDKNNVAFSMAEMIQFVLAWYDNCAQRRVISNVVSTPTWMSDYVLCYHRTFRAEHAYEGALGYYESLAKYRFMTDSLRLNQDRVNFVRSFEKMNLIPEVSWMLADYLTNKRTSVWASYLTEYIRHNVRDIAYKRIICSRAYSNMCDIRIDLNPNITIDDVDFRNEQAIFYFDNPFSNDFYTNFVYIRNLIAQYNNPELTPRS